VFATLKRGTIFLYLWVCCRESEGDLNTTTAFIQRRPREEEQQAQRQQQSCIPVSSIKEEVLDRPEVFVLYRRLVGVGS
jgi:hypothetical protein